LGNGINPTGSFTGHTEQLVQFLGFCQRRPAYHPGDLSMDVRRRKNTESPGRGIEQGLPPRTQSGRWPFPLSIQSSCEPFSIGWTMIWPGTSGCILAHPGLIFWTSYHFGGSSGAAACFQESASPENLPIFAQRRNFAMARTYDTKFYMVYARDISPLSPGSCISRSLSIRLHPGIKSYLTQLRPPTLCRNKGSFLEF